MKIIDRVELEAIETHLQSAGKGNYSDNMINLGRFEFHYSVVLSEEDFFGLVFLQNDEVLRIVPRGSDRTLRAVADRAINLGQPHLSANWNLASNLARMRKSLEVNGMVGNNLVIIKSRPNEEVFGPFYLQDGSHRALAYATLVQLNEVQFGTQSAFCSTNRELKPQQVTSVE